MLPPLTRESIYFITILQFHGYQYEFKFILETDTISEHAHCFECVLYYVQVDLLACIKKLFCTPCRLPSPWKVSDYLSKSVVCQIQCRLPGFTFFSDFCRILFSWKKPSIRWEIQPLFFLAPCWSFPSRLIESLIIYLLSLIFIASNSLSATSRFYRLSLNVWRFMRVIQKVSVRITKIIY